MWIALIITCGLVLMTGVASGFDYMAKKKIKYGKELERKVAILEQKLAALEESNQEKDGKIEQIAADISFMHKLIEAPEPPLGGKKGV